jgi:hypothetical protein
MNTNESRVYSLVELTEEYPRQWLAVSIVERESEAGQPLKVRLLSKDIDIYSIRAKVSSNDFCTLYTGPIPEIQHVMML